jgi:hypothetical protein
MTARYLVVNHSKGCPAASTWAPADCCCRPTTEEIGPLEYTAILQRHVEDKTNATLAMRRLLQKVAA